jgi:capsid protein
MKQNLLDKAISYLSPAAGVRRLAAKNVLHEFRYDGASMTHKRASAPQNISPNSFDVQRDRLQLMREAEDLERNFSPAKMLNRKVAMYSSPISYNAQTGDTELDKEIEDYLNNEVFPNCDLTGRYDFFKMMEFGIMGCNRGGDYGWAFQRPGLTEDMTPEEAVMLPLKIQAIEPDRIGGIYQNVVSDDYVSGCIIGEYGEIKAFRVFRRSMTTSLYNSPVDVPADQFVHLTDPMRIDQYRGVSALATAVQNLRDLYEILDYSKGKTKLASALTVFTNSNGATLGGGAADPYATTLSGGNAQVLQQDILFGQINHLQAGSEIKFPSSNSPSSEEQALMEMLLKLVAMSYNLPYSFAIDASALGGVSSRLESELAKAEFERVQRLVTPHAQRLKNAFLIDAVAKGIFPVSKLRIITRGRFGFRSHPQPDIGKEASAAVNLWQNGLLNPLKYWQDDAQDPETVADEMCRWEAIKNNASNRHGVNKQAVFGNGPAQPTAVSQSTSQNVQEKEFSRKEYRESDSSINERIGKETENIDFANGWIADLRESLQGFESNAENADTIQKLRIELDRANAYLAEHKAALDQLKSRRDRRDTAKPVKQEPIDKEKKAKNRNDRHELVKALIASGHEPNAAYAAAYKIIESGKFNPNKLPDQ